jgi:hypothetical protein
MRFAFSSNHVTAAQLVELFHNEHSEGNLLSGSNILRNNTKILPDFGFTTSVFLFVNPKMLKLKSAKFQ